MPATLPGSSGVEGVAVGDLNFDYWPDIVVSSVFQSSQVFLNQGLGDVSYQPIALPGSGQSSSVALGDLNGDGWLDILLGNSSQPSQVYLNPATYDLSALAPGTTLGTGNTYGVAIGDFNGDLAADVALANTPGPSQIYLNANDGTGGFATPIALPETAAGNTGAALGDFNHDSALDGVLSNLQGPSQVLLGNQRPPPDRLPNNAPAIALDQPCPQPADANVVDILYTLKDLDGDPIATVRGSYSLDAGVTWHTAVATDTISANLATSAAGSGHIFRWDTLASGIFASSDSVIFRIEAYSAALAGAIGRPGDFHYPNLAPSPIQRPGAAATTCTFHVQGNPVRVVSQDQPDGVPNAQVYRLPKGAIRGAKPVTDANGNPIRTDNSGYLVAQGDLAAGDRLFAMSTISDTLIGDRSLNFDGIDDFVALGQPAALNITGTIAIEAWVNVQATDGLRNVVARGYAITPALGEVFLRINWGQYQIGSWDGTDHLASYTIPQEDYGAWVHLAGMYDGTAWRLYRNGVEVSAVLDNTGAVPVTGGWAIGARGTGTERFFGGAMHDVRIWNIPRTPADILANMNRTLQGDEPGLAGSWPMDEGKDTIVHDRTSNRSNGTFSNGPAWGAGPPSPPSPAPPSGSLIFNGISDYVQLPSVAGLQLPSSDGFPPTGNISHTIEAWVRPDRLPTMRSWALLLGYPQFGAHHWLLNADGTTAIGSWSGAQAHPTLTPGGWHHIASVFDGTMLQVYVDGISTGSITATFDLQGVPLVLGQPPVYSSDEEQFFGGAISDVRIWKSPRTAAQVQADMRTRPAPNDPNLVLHWPLNDGANSTIAHDQTSNQNNGSFSKGPAWGTKVKYSLYQTSGDPSQTGVDMRPLTQPGVQTLTLARSRPLLLFNLDVSLEWDGSNDQQFKNQLEFDLQRTSELLYDWTNGQAALGNVSVYFNRERWDTADIQIFATNRMRPTPPRVALSPTIPPRSSSGPMAPARRCFTSRAMCAWARPGTGMAMPVARSARIGRARWRTNSATICCTSTTTILGWYHSPTEPSV